MPRFFGERRNDGPSLLEHAPRLSLVAHAHIKLAELAMAGSQVCLPSGIAGIGLGEALENGEAVAIGFQRVGQGALGLQHIAHLDIGDREIALPSGIAGIGLGEALYDG